MISAIQKRLGPFIVTVFMVICLSFLFYTSVMPSFDRQSGARDIGKIDGTKVKVEDFRAAESAAEMMLVLKYGGIPDSADLRRALQVESWQRLLLLASAKEWGIRTTDQEVVDFLQSRRLFQKDGQYQPELYERFKASFLLRENINSQKFEEMTRDQITTEKAEKLIVSPVQVTAEQMNDAFNLGFSKTTLSIIQFDQKDQVAKATASAEEIEKAYKEEIETNAAWRTKEKRQVSYVRFELNAEEQKLTGTAKDEARRKVAEKALSFAQTVSGDSEQTQQSSFTEQAKQAQLPSGTTGLFARDEAPAPLPPSPNFNLAAFRLLPERPVSSVVETDRGFYILHMDKIEPSKARPLAEVRGLVEEEIKKRKSLIMTVEAGRAAAAALKTEVEKGVPFAKAAAALNLKVETPAAFVPANPKQDDNNSQQRMMCGIAISLPLHGVTSFLPTGNGGLVATVESREKPEASKLAEMENGLRASLLTQGRQIVLQEWFRMRGQSKGTVEPQGLYGKQ